MSNSFIKSVFFFQSCFFENQLAAAGSIQARRHDMESSWHNYRSDVLMLAGMYSEFNCIESGRKKVSFS